MKSASQSSRFKSQRGAISLMGAASIALSFYAFDQMLEYGNAKILDRELDNYAKTVASVALRSELALTKAGIDAGSMQSNQTDLITDSVLQQVEMYTKDSDDNDLNLYKQITFGNMNESGQFEALGSDASNPRSAETPADFSAVAVQIWSSDSFYTFTPQGRAIAHIDNTEGDNGCYCKNRYTACLDQELTATDLSPISSSQAALIAVKDSDARENYCRYGYTPPRSDSSVTTKYPWAQFDDGWIGREPDTVNFFMFYQQGYSDAAFSRVLSHQPLNIPDGEDPLYQTGGMFAGMLDMMSDFMPGFFNSDERKGYEQDQSTYTKSEISPSSLQSDFRCLKSGFFGSSSVVGCDESGFSIGDTVLNDAFYIGYQGTCVDNTSKDNVTMSRCLSYDDSGTSRYESCLDIERRSTMQMNFFERMMAFFFGPILSWERAYEGLDCEMQQMRYKGWLFWGGWEEV